MQLGMLYTATGSVSCITPRNGQMFEAEELCGGPILKAPIERKNVWIAPLPNQLPYNAAGTRAAGYGPLNGNVLVVFKARGRKRPVLETVE